MLLKEASLKYFINSLSGAVDLKWSFISSIEESFLINEQGIIQAVWRKVKVPGHVDSILEILTT